jgi:eukaryotic-like serine/threonine-protein kinase
MHAVMGTGRVIAGRYRLLGPVGRGAMGIVWRGCDELLDRDVAAKEVQITALTLPAEAEVAYQRTLREARTAARLSHPGVVTVFDVVEEDGSPWIIMELIIGRSLDQVIAEDGPLPPVHAAQLGATLVGALAIAHAAGVLHRDVKPSNVLIAADGRTVLTDFGIATFAEDPALTQAGMIVGTPGFTAPERVRGGSATPASDLWSLGATLYAAVEGRGPFERPGGSVAISAGVAIEEAPRAPSAGPLAPVIDALLRRDPDTRPDGTQTATMLADVVATGSTDGDLGGLGLGALGGPGADALGGMGGMGGGLGGLGAGLTGLHSGHPSFPGSPAFPGSSGSPRSPGSDAGAAGTALGDAPAGRHAAAAAADATGSRQADLADRGPVDPAAEFLSPPDYAGLRMPGLDADAAPGSRASGYHERTAGLPEFLDPPRASGDTSGPPGASGASGAPGPVGQPDWPSARGRPGVWPRHWRIATVGGAIAAIVVAAVIGFGVYSRSLASGAPDAPDAAPDPTIATGPSASTPASTSPSAGTSASPGGTATSPSAGPSQGGAAPSHSAPTGHGSTAPTSSPTTSPSHGTGGGGSGGSGGGLGKPPPGYEWHKIKPADLGTKGGFAIAAPRAWHMTIQGISIIFAPPTGSASIAISLEPFTYPGPVREARYLQHVAKQQDPGYRLGAVKLTDFMGQAAALSRYSWLPHPMGARTVVLAELVTLPIPAGTQSYAMTVTAPAPRMPVLRPVYQRMKFTFQPLPRG